MAVNRDHNNYDINFVEYNYVRGPYIRVPTRPYAHQGRSRGGGGGGGGAQGAFAPPLFSPESCNINITSYRINTSTKLLQQSSESKIITEKLTKKLSVNKLSSYASIEQCLVWNLERLMSSKGTKRSA